MFIFARFMIFKRFISSVFILSFYPFFLNAQSPQDPISISGLNEKYLEHLIKEKIDEVRVNHNLSPLFNDSILFVAAKYHSSYLYKKGELSHFEMEHPKFETPQKRADQFGAVNYLVGENVALTFVNIPAKDKKGKVHTNETYEQTATDFVTMWVNSPGHYKNIITPDYNATGLAIWTDTKTNTIYAVQKFAQILFKYSFEERKSFFPYSNYKSPIIARSFDGIGQSMHKGKHAHKLKIPKSEKACVKCGQDKSSFDFGMTWLERRGNNIYLSSYSYSAILNLLNKRKDGFAAEIVVYNPYDCGNPQYYTSSSRRNKQCVFSGKVLKPVYKKKALRGFKPSGKNKRKIEQNLAKSKIKKFEIKLGKVPKGITEYYEVNLVVIQKKKVCAIKHFSSFCGDTLKKFYELPFLHDSIFNNAELKPEFEKISFGIPFQKGKTDYKISDIKPITDSLLSENFIADTIVIKAYSSVEGNEIINKQLQEQRSKNIAAAISSQQNEKLNTRILVEENWDLFEKQINDNKDLLAYKNLTKSKIKEKLLDTLEQKRIENYLSKQRTAQVKLHAKQIINDKNVEKYILKKLQSQKLKLSRINGSGGKKDSLRDCLHSMQVLMEVTYNQIKKGIIKPDFFEQFSIGNDESYNDYNLIKVKYWVQIHGIKQDDLEWSKKVYRELVNLYNNKAKSFYIIYNMLNLIQQHGDQLSVLINDKDKDSFLEELYQYHNDSLDRTLTEKIGLNFWFSLCQLPRYQQTKSNLPLYLKSMKNIHDYFADKELPMQDINKLAKFYIFHCRADWAYEILWPEFEKRKNNPEGIKLLAKILYQNYEETHNAPYYDLLIKIYDRLGKEAWCPMFVGPCNISFQAFDYDFFRNFYCEKCHDYLNYAKSPTNENKKGD